jgi:putative sugar O-methyltransferase
MAGEKAFFELSSVQDPYQNFESVRNCVLELMASNSRRGVSTPSDYWSEELAGFDYVLEAGPKLVSKLRQHSFHLTGTRVYDYRSSQKKRQVAFEKKLHELRKVDTSGLFVPESPILGGFGHRIGDDLVNIDTLKFYESLIALDRAGVISDLRRLGSPLVLEIGGGWGGFGYQMRTLCPNTRYAIVDFPEVFLFSATYLMTAFPGSKVVFVTGNQGLKETDLTSHDFVFIPQEVFRAVWRQKVDLAVNMVSFQEMTSEQVRAYAEIIRDCGTTYLYSHNRDRSGHNDELTSVSEILSEIFTLRPIEVLDGEYTNLEACAPVLESTSPQIGEKRGKLERLLPKFLLRQRKKPASQLPKKKKKKKKDPLHQYRHFIGAV